MTNTFDGPSWIAGGRRMDGIREEWSAATYAAQQSEPAGGNESDIDSEVLEQTETLRMEWYQLIGEMQVTLGSEASRMRATGENYSATEQQAVDANTRFWGNE